VADAGLWSDRNAGDVTAALESLPLCLCAGTTVLARVVVVVGQSLRFDPGPLLQRRLIEEVLLGG
jgi:hypothetical protein